MLLITKCNPGLGPARSHTLQTQQQRVPHRCLHSGVIANAQPTGRKATQPRTVSPDDAAPSIASKQQPNWTEGMARIQGLMGRVQDQLQALSKLRLSSNPALLTELRDKAEQHLEVLMLLAESQQKQHIEDSSGGSSSKAASSSSSSKDLQRLLKELEQQLDLEHQAMVTAVASATSTPSSTPDPQQQGPNTTSSSSSRRRTKTQSQAAAGTTADPTTTQQPAAADAAAAVLQQQRLADAESKVTKLQRQLEDAEYVIQATADELSEHRELQMAYDKQCQDLYRLRMQLQLVRTQGHDAASVAAHANKQHKQDVAWLMDAHRKELAEAHRKNQDLIHEVQQMRLKLLEQEQQLWSLGATAGSGGGAANSQQAAASQQQQQQEQAQQQLQQRAQEQEQLEQEQKQQRQAEEEEKREKQRQEEVQLQAQQLQVLQASAQQLTAEKQQLMKSLQDSQREQAVLLVELNNVRSAAAAAEAAAAAATAAGSSRDAAAEAAVVEAVAAAEQVLKVQLQEAEQQRDKLVNQVRDLQTNLQEAKAAAAAAQAAASAQPPVVAVAAAAAAAGAAVTAGLGGLDAAAAIGQLKVAKVEMAQLRVQLADARRELRQASGRAAAAEAELQQRAADYEARLAKLQTWYNKQAAVVAQLRKGKAPRDGQVGFTNTNKFWVKQELLFEFLKHWVSREAQLQQQEGFLGLQVQPGVSLTPDGGVDVVVSSLWASIPDWEAWSKSAAGTKQHMPANVYQYVPARGSFPEAFVPFRDYDEAVNAKY